MKRLFIFMVVSVLFIANAAAEVKTGTCGANITWEFDTEGTTLTLTGSGEMVDFEAWDLQEWHKATVKINYTPTISFDVPITTFIEKVEINGDITSIGNNAFKGCTALKEITLPNTIKRIGVSAFENCSALATTGNAPTDLEEIGEKAFYGCSEMVDDYGVIYMGTVLVSGSPLTTDSDIRIEAGTTKILNKAFENNTTITSISFAKDKNTRRHTLKTIGDEAFAGCTNLEEAVIPNTVTSWGENIFKGCTNLYNAGEYVLLKIEDTDYEYATDKEEYVISDGIKYIADNAFTSCTNIKRIICEGEEIPTAAENAFKFNVATPNLYVADGLEDEYANNWKTFIGKINTTNLTIGASEYSTFALNHSAKVPEGMKVFTAEVTGENEITITEVKQIAKGEGYIAYGKGNFTFEPAKKVVSERNINDMIGVYENTELSGDDVYLLSKYNDVVGFRCLGNENTYTLPAGKAYLQIPSFEAKSTFYTMKIGENATGIENVESEESASKVRGIFNMAGQQLSEPQKGLNIINGKKVILK